MRCAAGVTAQHSTSTYKYIIRHVLCACSIPQPCGGWEDGGVGGEGGIQFINFNVILNWDAMPKHVICALLAHY